VTINLSAWQTFTEVVEARSFAEAGRRLGYTSSAISQQISAFERSLGVKLFERGAHSIQITAAGQYLWQQNRGLTELLDRLQRDITSLAIGEIGKIRVGCFPSAGTSLLAPVICRMMTSVPGCEVSASEGEPADLLPLLTAGDLDLVVGFQYDSALLSLPDSVRMRTIMSDPVRVVAAKSHPLAQLVQVDFSMLSDQSWVTNSENTLAHDCLLNLAAAAKFSPNIVFRTNNFAIIHSILEETRYVALIPDLAFAPASLVAHLSMPPVAYREVFVLTRIELDQLPLIGRFIDWLTERAQQCSDGDARRDGSVDQRWQVEA
jgi:DNA-binding transcriptional LysR family regulator